MNREGRSYRSSRDEGGSSPINGSIVLVTRSEKWSPHLTDEQSNFTHVCLVLECPKDPSQVGREVRLDERKGPIMHSGVTGPVGYWSSWTSNDGYVDI
jgi:hypothetical protein